MVIKEVELHLTSPEETGKKVQIPLWGTLQVSYFLSYLASLCHISPSKPLLLLLSQTLLQTPPYFSTAHFPVWSPWPHLHTYKLPCTPNIRVSVVQHSHSPVLSYKKLHETRKKTWSLVVKGWSRKNSLACSTLFYYLWNMITSAFYLVIQW